MRRICDICKVHKNYCACTIAKQLAIAKRNLIERKGKQCKATIGYLGDRQCLNKESTKGYCNAHKHLIR